MNYDTKIILQVGKECDILEEEEEIALWEEDELDDTESVGSLRTITKVSDISYLDKPPQME